ncbi:MAG: nucleotidyl transferase AbiEii/AbiGii toxin family protein [Prevotellaceae bacterium]|jgi:predicted nucleotidyltransferase component of viral defense system|nr:nucleotidyl transferase AbiEii/AbiGii toxin family protein [Prevotellaceae bacterium]
MIKTSADNYKAQVALLLDILPIIAEEKVFALHGGTAINLFHLDMPRFSVDIDLTYIPFSSDRNTDLENIRKSLETIKNRIRKQKPHIRFKDQQRASKELKLFCSVWNRYDIQVKVEVNQINRGLITQPDIRNLCLKAQKSFDTFCKIQTVSPGQLWGGKINAALDRQHPRDLFDVRNMFNETGYTDEIKTGFLFFLSGGKRPFHELLNPQRIEQQEVFESQFIGMADQPFSYEEFQETRERLIFEVNGSLTEKDREFLIAFSKGEPVWDTVDYSMYPAIRWKLINIRELKNNNPQKCREQTELLRQSFEHANSEKPGMTLVGQTQFVKDEIPINELKLLGLKLSDLSATDMKNLLSGKETKTLFLKNQKGDCLYAALSLHRNTDNRVTILIKQVEQK